MVVTSELLFKVAKYCSEKSPADTGKVSIKMINRCRKADIHTASVGELKTK